MCVCVFVFRGGERPFREQRERSERERERERSESRERDSPVSEYGAVLRRVFDEFAPQLQIGRDEQGGILESDESGP